MKPINHLPRTKKEIEEDEKKKKEQEAEKERIRLKEEEERKKRIQENKKRQQAVQIAQAKIKALEQIRKEEETYELILSKMINDPGSVTKEDLDSLGKDVEKLKQEAENNIWKMPREKRDQRLALIRGDTVSPKTFTEMSKTAIGLQSSLEKYIGQVNRIPTGTINEIQSINAP